MGIGLLIGVLAMLAAGATEIHRLKYVDSKGETRRRRLRSIQKVTENSGVRVGVAGVSYADYDRSGSSGSENGLGLSTDCIGGPSLQSLCLVGANLASTLLGWASKKGWVFQWALGLPLGNSNLTVNRDAIS
ncbi:hypothetical protein Sjap_011683 [Stephania japonica]|uniref:Uncharacterized protein n=1 Tax=Stephania japonica TaxID=461633 RepID=A0AAP0JBS9_9MAGN